jgi:hypothetical protein
MNSPGFTAEASVYKSRGYYRRATDRARGVIAPVGHRLLPQLGKRDLPGASCGKASVFGNVVCVECTPGPFPTCKTYVCDKDGSNCKESVRINTQLMTASLSNVLKAAPYSEE